MWVKPPASCHRRSRWSGAFWGAAKWTKDDWGPPAVQDIRIWGCLKIVYPYTQWFCWSLSLLNGYNWGYTPFQTYPYIRIYQNTWIETSDLSLRAWTWTQFKCQMYPNVVNWTRHGQFMCTRPVKNATLIIPTGSTLFGWKSSPRRW